MSVRRLAEVQPESFDFTPESREWIERQIAKYPDRRQASAVVPLLWQAQKQTDGWLTRPAIEKVAKILDMQVIRVLEIATFYTMFNLEPVGKNFIQLCTTTPCMLRGTDSIKDVLYARIGEQNHVTPDGLFSWMEVECLGACCNAPMAQINDDYFEDLTPENLNKLLDDLAAGRAVRAGSQSGRQTSEPAGRLTTLVSLYGEDGHSGPDSAEGPPTPPDFPGVVPPHQKQPGLKDDSAPRSEPAMQSIKRTAEDNAGRPKGGVQHGEPRTENPVHEFGERQESAPSREPAPSKEGEA